MDDNKKPTADSLMDSIVNISKAGAYDIVCKQRDELLNENEALTAKVKDLENLTSEYAGKLSANLEKVSLVNTDKPPIKIEISEENEKTLHY